MTVWPFCALNQNPRGKISSPQRIRGRLSFSFPPLSASLARRQGTPAQMARTFGSVLHFRSLSAATSPAEFLFPVKPLAGSLKLASSRQLFPCFTSAPRQDTCRPTVSASAATLKQAETEQFPVDVLVTETKLPHSSVSTPIKPGPSLLSFWFDVWTFHLVSFHPISSWILHEILQNRVPTLLCCIAYSRFCLDNCIRFSCMPQFVFSNFLLIDGNREVIECCRLS